MQRAGAIVAGTGTGKELEKGKETIVGPAEYLK
jgi:hypothetical protein